jgi:hypothetical protein
VETTGLRIQKGRMPTPKPRRRRSSLHAGGTRCAWLRHCNVSRARAIRVPPTYLGACRAFARSANARGPGAFLGGLCCKRLSDSATGTLVDLTHG